MSNASPATVAPRWELHHRLARSLEFGSVKVSEMASYIDVSERTMSNYLAGVTQPRRPALIQWALRCGVPLAWLEHGDNAPDGGSDLPEHSSACIVVDFTDHRDSRPGTAAQHAA